MEAARVWRSADGRIRLGFRLLLFMVFLSVVVILTAPFSPPVLPWSAVPTLLGALLAGWGLLSLEGRPAASLGFRLDRGAVRGVVVGLALGVLVGLLAVVLIAAAGAVRWRAQGGDLGRVVLGRYGELMDARFARRGRGGDAARLPAPSSG